MNEIIKEAEDKIENDRLEKEKEKERIEEEKEKELLEKEKEKEKEGEEEKDEYVLVGAAPKKNVFAKFKKYNETPTTVKSISSGGNGQMQMQQPIQSQTTTQNKMVILKDKTNRYTCEGKLANYSIIKKVDRKVVDKNYALTFADYKKIMYDKKNL